MKRVMANLNVFFITPRTLEAAVYFFCWHFPIVCLIYLNQRSVMNQAISYLNFGREVVSNDGFINAIFSDSQLVLFCFIK